MFEKIVGAIVIIMAVLSVFAMFSYEGLTFIGQSAGIVAGVSPFAFMIPVRVRPGSLTEHHYTRREI